MILVTGGSGFLGQALLKRLQGPIRVMARNEGNLIKLKQSFPEIEIFPGDVGNYSDCYYATKGVTQVYHLAAFKHVTEAEKFASQCIHSNVTGSKNILRLSLEREFEFVLGISTDKAAQVSGVYGASKLLMERMFLQYEQMNDRTKYRIVRYGNVLYSTGSVLCKWKELIESGKQIQISDPEATRFYWSSDEAIDLMFECLGLARSSEPFIPEMKSMRIGTLRDAMFKKYSNNNGPHISENIGLQLGENKHETLHENGPYSNEVEQYTIEEIMERI